MSRRINASEYRGGEFPPLRDFSALRFGQLALDFAGTFLKKSFSHNADDMPVRREKIIHALGSTATVELTGDPESPYTGLFKGALGIARLSLAVRPSENSAYTPGMGLKLFVDGKPSLNFQAMNSLDGQGTDQNFFAKEFSNVIARPESASLKILEGFFARAVKNTVQLETLPHASVTRDGASVARPVAPCQIWFSPAAEVKGLIRSDSKNDFRDELAKIQAGTTLYDVYGTTECGAGERTYVGSLKTTSRFVASVYGDEALFFKHEERK